MAKRRKARFGDSTAGHAVSAGRAANETGVSARNAIQTVRKGLCRTGTLHLLEAAKMLGLTLAHARAGAKFSVYEKARNKFHHAQDEVFRRCGVR